MKRQRSLVELPTSPTLITYRKKNPKQRVLIIRRAEPVVEKEEKQCPMRVRLEDLPNEVILLIVRFIGDWNIKSLLNFSETNSRFLSIIRNSSDVWSNLDIQYLTHAFVTRNEAESNVIPHAPKNTSQVIPRYVTELTYRLTSFSDKNRPIWEIKLSEINNNLHYLYMNKHKEKECSLLTQHSINPINFYTLTLIKHDYHKKNNNNKSNASIIKHLVFSKDRLLNRIRFHNNNDNNNNNNKYTSETNMDVKYKYGSKIDNKVLFDTHENQKETKVIMDNFMEAFESREITTIGSYLKEILLTLCKTWRDNKI